MRDTRSGIERIELSVRDEQNRWPATGWQFETDHLEYDVNWNRQFEDGTWAPTGSYQVLLQAWDRLGNGRYITGRIYIPAAGETPVITSQGMISVGVMEETPSPMVSETPAAGLGMNEETTLTPSQPPMVVPISGGEAETVLSALEESESDLPKNVIPLSDGILWGAAALAAGAAAALVSARQLRKTRAREEAKIYQQILDGIARRWNQMVANVVAYNNAQAKLANDKALEAAAKNAAFEEEKQEQFGWTQAKVSDTITAYQAENANENDNSNQVKAFRDGEETSNGSYNAYSPDAALLNPKEVQEPTKNLPAWIQSTVSLAKDWLFQRPDQMNAAIHQGNIQTLVDGSTRRNLTITGQMTDSGREALELFGTGTNNVSTVTTKVVKNNILQNLPFGLGNLGNTSTAIKSGVSGAKTGIKSFTDPLADVAISAGFNAYDAFVVNDDLPTGEQWKNFAVGTVVDGSADIVIGAGAAAIVGIGFSIAIALGVIATAPVAAIIGATIVVSAALGYAFSATGADKAIKKWVSNLF